jgi:hypothetical protein
MMRLYHRHVSLDFCFPDKLLTVVTDHPSKTCTCSASSSTNPSRPLISVKTVKDFITQNLRSHLENDLVKLVGSLVPMQTGVAEAISQGVQQSISKAMDGTQDKSHFWASQIYSNGLNQQREQPSTREDDSQNPPNVIIQTSQFSQLVDNQSGTNRHDIHFMSYILEIDNDTAPSTEDDADPTNEVEGIQISSGEEDNITSLGGFLDPSSFVQISHFDFTSSPSDFSWRHLVDENGWL